ncbi:MAG TPA: hypothetical protein VHS09_07225, partial [Polyangiaceae bacterium]|nr:hypothetical protein [Polyangiaceae bacterium]
LPIVLALALGLAPAAGACGSGGSGVTACKTIEEARCKQVPSCPNVAVSPPLWYTTGSAVDACIRYYDTACLHGLAIGSEPSSSDVSQCVDAINGSCATVATPQSDPACAWLIPPADEDGGDGGDASDGGDATDAADSASD